MTWRADHSLGPGLGNGRNRFVVATHGRGGAPEGAKEPLDHPIEVSLLGLGVLEKVVSYESGESREMAAQVVLGCRRHRRGCPFERAG